jgi:hypothetical protein
VSILVDHLRAKSDGRLAGWRESGAISAGPANGRLVLTSEGGRANEEQGRTASILSSCRSTPWFFLILLEGRTSNKELSLLREGFFSIIKMASRY